MFLDYLKNKESEVNEQINIKKNELSEIDIRIKENKKFYEMLENGKTTPFTEFTPQIITASDKKKKQNLTEEEIELQKKKKNIIDSITVLEIEHENITSAITDAKNRFSEIKNAHSLEKKEIISRINRILERNVSDPLRSNIELKELLKFLENE